MRILALVILFPLALAGRGGAQEASLVDQLQALASEATTVAANRNTAQANELLDRVQLLDKATALPVLRDAGMNLLAIATALVTDADVERLEYVFKRGIEILQSSPDGRTSDVLLGLYNLAALYDHGDNAAARDRIFAIILDHAADAPDLVDVDSAKIFLELAGLYVNADRFSPAAILYSSVHGLMMETFGNDATSIGNWLAKYSGVLVADRQCDKAVRLFDGRRAASVSVLVSRLEQCGALLLEDKRPVDAANYLQQALTLRESTAGQTPRDIAGTLSLLATAHFKSGEFDDASREYWRAIMLRRSDTPPAR